MFSLEDALLNVEEGNDADLNAGFERGESEAVVGELERLKEEEGGDEHKLELELDSANGTNGNGEASAALEAKASTSTSTPTPAAITQTESPLAVRAHTPTADNSNTNSLTSTSTSTSTLSSSTGTVPGRPVLRGTLSYVDQDEGHIGIGGNGIGKGNKRLLVMKGTWRWSNTDAGAATANNQHQHQHQPSRELPFELTSDVTNEPYLLFRDTTDSRTNADASTASRNGVCGGCFLPPPRGLFSGHFVVPYPHVTVLGKRSLKNKKFQESGVELAFDRETDNTVYKVRGSGRNDLGTFSLVGTARRATHYNGSATAGSYYTVELQKTYTGTPAAANSSGSSNTSNNNNSSLVVRVKTESPHPVVVAGKQQQQQQQQEDPVRARHHIQKKSAESCGTKTMNSVR
uniref:Uncharacterized protein n=1 Tax=Pseudo-nitzschia australis TaxID=44445 RepID=A0A7S4EP52_9STRA